MKRLIPVCILLLASVCLQAGQQNGAAEQRFEIAARRYQFQPSEITVKKGIPVVLVLRSEDVTHGLLIRSLGIKQDVRKNAPVTVRFTPEQTGDLVALCSHFCGSGHGGMRLVIHVTE